MIRLKELRDSRHLSQTEFGKIFGASQNTVSNWENGNRRIDNERLIQFAEFFGVSVDYLMGRDTAPVDQTREALSARVSKLSPEKLEQLASYLRFLEQEEQNK